MCLDLNYVVTTCQCPNDVKCPYTAQDENSSTCGDGSAVLFPAYKKPSQSEDADESNVQ
jgi:hypothetical protein